MKGLLAGAVAQRAIPILAAIMPVLAILTSKGLVIPVALCAVLLILSRPRLPARDDRLLAIPALLFVWAVLSLTWTVDRSVSWDVWRLALDLLMALALYLEIGAADAEGRARVLNHLTTGCVAAVLAVAFIHVTYDWLPKIGDKHWHIKVKPAVSILAVVMWPVAVHLWRERSALLAAAFVAGTVVAISSGDASTAPLSFAVAVVVFAVSLIWHRVVAWALAGMTAIAILVMPILAAQPMKYLDQLRGVKTTGLHRLAIWDFVTQRIAEHPLLGWGFNASRVIPGGKEKVLGIGEALPLHPHNIALQLWLELGVVGAVLLAASLAVLVLATRRWERKAAAGALAAYAATLVFMMMSYGAWQDWWLATLAFVLVACRALRQET